MANQKSKDQGLGRFIYYRDTGEMIQVSKEEHDTFYAGTDRIRHREQYYGRCICTKQYQWVCDGECVGCQFRVTGNVASLDETDSDGIGAYDYLPDESKPVDEMVADRDLINHLLERFRELDPEADTIIQLWEEHPEGISDRAIARSLGRPHQTFTYQMTNYRKILRKYLGDKA